MTRLRLPIVASLLAGTLVLSGCANEPPSASFTVSPTTGQTVTLDASASKGGTSGDDQPYQIDTYEWDLDGNGTWDRTTTSPTTTHTFSGTRTVKVSLRVTNEDSARSETARTVATSPSATASTEAYCDKSSWDNYSCGSTDAAGSPLGSAEEPVAARRQPEPREPVFGSNFAGPGEFAIQGQPSQRVAVASAANSVWVLTADSEVKQYDATTLGFVRSWSTQLGWPRDIAAYRGDIYVLASDGDVAVFDGSGNFKRLLRPALHLDQQLANGLGRLEYGNMAVAWNELWLTVSLGNARGSGVLVFDAATGTLKSGGVHLARSDCGYMGSPVYLTCTQEGSNDTGDAASLNSTMTAGISAVPELGALFTQCRGINRRNLFGLTTGDDTVSEADVLTPPACELGYWRDSWMGTDAVWGMKWFLQMYRVPDASSPGGYSDFVQEYSLGSRTDAAGRPIAAPPERRRTWRPRDDQTNNHRDVSYRPRDTRVDWSGVLTQNPTAWLRSASPTSEDKCLHYIVSAADIYVVGHRGERWYDLASVSSVELRIDGRLIKTSAAAEGDFCISTQGTYNGYTIGSGNHSLEVKANLTNGAGASATNPGLRTDNTPPSGHVTAPASAVTGTVAITGHVEDPHSGPKTWQLQYQPPGSGAWTTICTLEPPVPDPSCDWNTAGLADGRYQLRAYMADNATDGGNTAYTPQVMAIVDHSPPVIASSGELVDGEDLRPFVDGERPAADVTATDVGAGVTSVDFRVDGVSQRAATQGCGQAGGCSLTDRFELVPENQADGQHTISLVATDALGHEATKSWVIDVERFLPGQDGPDPDPEDPGPSDDPWGQSASASASPYTAYATTPAADIPALPGTPASPFLPCTSSADPANFPAYWLGQSFESLPMTASDRTCFPPGAGDPIRENSVTYIYGSCDPPSTSEDSSCMPPLQVQTWPACERSLASYSLGPEDLQIEYQQTVLRGSPGAIFEGGIRLEIYTGKSTVILFGTDPAQVTRAVAAVQQKSAGSGLPSVSETLGSLPEPAAGALQGTMPCLG